MPAPRRPHCDPVKRIAQYAGQIAGGEPGANRVRRLAQFVDQSGQRAAIRPAP